MESLQLSNGNVLYKKDLVLLSNALSGLNHPLVDTKISAMTNTTSLQSGDFIPLARSGANYHIDVVGNAANIRSNLGVGSSDSPTFTGLTLSGLTQGSVLFAGAAGVISQNDTNFSWDNSNNVIRVKSLAVGEGITGAANTAVDVRVYGGNPIISCSRVNGTLGAESAVVNGNILGAFAARGYGANTFNASQDALISFVAAENWTNSAHGCYINLEVTLSGSTTRTSAGRISNAGNWYFGGGVNALNKVDIAGGCVIGASHASSVTAPTNGLGVQGKAFFGASSLGTADYLFSVTNAQNNFRLQSTNSSNVILSLLNGSAEWQIFNDTSGDLYFWASASLVSIDTNGNLISLLGNFKLNTAGRTLYIKEGSNACKGTGAVLVGGTVTVNTTAVNSGDQVIVTKTAAGGTAGFITVTIVNATSFTLTSSSGTDTSTFSWWILKAA